jgi:peptidyl-dipeptidase Dcp
MASDTPTTSEVNRAITNWDGPLGLPDFARIDDGEFDAAFAVALPAHLAEIEAIADNPDTPTFEKGLT